MLSFARRSEPCRKTIPAWGQSWASRPRISRWQQSLGKACLAALLLERFGCMHGVFNGDSTLGPRDTPEPARGQDTEALRFSPRKPGIPDTFSYKIAGSCISGFVAGSQTLLQYIVSVRAPMLATRTQSS